MRTVTQQTAVRATGGSLRLWLALATVYLVWGSTYLAIRVMVETMPPLLGAGARFLLAGAVMAAWLLVSERKAALRVSRRELLAAGGVAVLLLVGGNGLVTVAEQDAPSGLSALIIAATPLFVVVLRLLAREAVSRVTLAAVGGGFAGVAILVVPADRPDGAALWSVLALVAASASWAVGSFVAGRVALPASIAVTTALEMLVGGAVLVVLGVAAGEGSELALGDYSGRSWLGLAYLVLAGSLLAFTAYAWLLQNAPISTVATYAYVNPVVAVVLGWLVLSEEVTLTMLAGAVAIVVSVAFVVRQESAAPVEGGRPPRPRGRSPRALPDSPPRTDPRGPARALEREPHV